MAKTKTTEKRGGSRKGAGRPTLYPNKTNIITIGLTDEGWKKLKVVQSMLATRKKLATVSRADALEEAIRRVHRELTRDR